MKIINYTTALAIWLLTIGMVQAQETSSLESLKATKEAIIQEEKNLLTKEVESIIQRQENKEITYEEAEQLKNEAAEKHALNIENRIAIVDNKIALIQRNKGEWVLDDEDRTVLKINFGDDENIVYLGKKYSERKYDKRTKSFLTFAIGLNNAIGEGQSIDDSDFKIGGSRFVELGLTWKTRVFKESNWLRLMYGVSFQFNALKPTDNRYFVDTGEQTLLQSFELDLDKSKFRMSNLVVPVHFEFGPSKKIEKDDYFRYSTHNKFKMGVGGYAGFNLATRQILRFNENGDEVRQKIKGDFNTSNVIYGVSAYAGFSDLSLYFKYDLNPIFQNNTTDLNNISLGLRWDWD